MNRMKFFLVAILLPALSPAAILPETIGPYHLTNGAPVAIQEKSIWDEYGLKETQSGKYEHEKDSLTVTAWRLGDTTASMAAFEWQRPAKSTPSKLAPMAVETADGVLLVHGNYLFSFHGRKPEPAELAALTASLKNVDGTSLPVLPSYLPGQDRVSNSERYITGPETLASFYPGVPPSVAAFHYGAEAAAAIYKSGKNETRLAVFNYPTHQIAMQREAEFSKVPGAVVKRSGPLVAVVLNPPDPDTAERLLSQVRYQATVTLDEYVPTKRDNIGNLVVNAFSLIGILLAFALISGLAVGGFRAFRRRGPKGEEADAILALHLDRH
jgi:hypothetical protein